MGPITHKIGKVRNKTCLPLCEARSIKRIEPVRALACAYDAFDWRKPGAVFGVDFDITKNGAHSIRVKQADRTHFRPGGGQQRITILQLMEYRQRRGEYRSQADHGQNDPCSDPEEAKAGHSQTLDRTLHRQRPIGARFYGEGGEIIKKNDHVLSAALNRSQACTEIIRQIRVGLGLDDPG